MKKICFSISMLLFITTLLLVNGSLAQDYIYYLTLGEYTNPVSTLAFSPDGRMIASAGRNVQLWNAATGQLIRTFARHAGYSHSISFSPDGKTLASGCEDYSEMEKLTDWSPDIHLWDASTGIHKQKFIGHRSSVRSLAFSPDGTILASGSLDKTIRLWDAATGLHRKTLIGHTEGVTRIVFSPDGQTVATVGGEVRLWDAATGLHRKTLTGSPPALIVTYSPSSDGDLITGPSPPVAVSFSPDGQTLAIAIHRDNRIHLWNIVSNEYRTPFPTRHSSGVQDVCFSPDGQTLATVGLLSVDNTLCLWDSMSGEHKSTLTSKQGFDEVHFSFDGRMLAAGGQSGAIVHFWKLSSVGPVETTPLTLSKLSADQIYDNAIRSVMWIVNPDIGEGSGVLINKQFRLAITNAHVTGTQNTIDVYFPAPDENGELIKDRNFYLTNSSVLKRLGYYTKGHVVARNEKTDLAIIKLEGLPETAHEVDWNFNTPTTNTGDMVYILGNPGGQDLWRWTLGEFLNDQADFLHIQSDVFGGNSGGPVLNKQGILVGIVARSDRHMNALAIPVRDINELLFESGLEHSRFGR